MYRFHKIKSNYQESTIDFDLMQINSINKQKIYRGVDTNQINTDYAGNFWTIIKNQALSFIKEEGWLLTSEVGEEVIKSNKWNLCKETIMFPESIVRKLKFTLEHIIK